jgi:predicted HicB family RNase H-like nuclease
VLVTGIQPDQVLGLERLFRAADAALLDPCDEHRDEGRRRRSPPKRFLQRRASYETRIALRADKTNQSFNAIIDLAEAVINSK